MIWLFEIESKVIPLRTKEWAVLELHFEKGCEERKSFRDQDSLSQKFDNLMSRKKSKDDLSGLEQARAAKHAARDIRGRASAGEVGEWSEEDVGTGGVDSSSGGQASVFKQREREEAKKGCLWCEEKSRWRRKNLFIMLRACRR